jgi:hypothetical protein
LKFNFQFYAHEHNRPSNCSSGGEKSSLKAYVVFKEIKTLAKAGVFCLMFKVVRPRTPYSFEEVSGCFVN